MKNMSTDSHNLKNLLSAERAGALFAPFRSRGSNVDGFDSKMKLWIAAIEEWLVSKNQLTFCLHDIQQSFVSENGLKPDRECLRLVLSEMKRRSLIESLANLQSSLSSTSYDRSYLDQVVNPNGWFGWTLKTFVLDTSSWLYCKVFDNARKNQDYSDIMDRTIQDRDKFICGKSINIVSEKLLTELIRISKAEEQTCFEWRNLFELLEPILSTITVLETSSELSFTYEFLIFYLKSKRSVSVADEDNTRFIKIANCDTSLYSSEDSLEINQADKAMALLKRDKESLTIDSDKLRHEAEVCKAEALDHYNSFKRNKSNSAKVKSLRILRKHAKLMEQAESKENVLIKVESLIQDLKDIRPNISTYEGLKAYSAAMKQVNNRYVDILDEVRDIAEENEQKLGVPDKQKSDPDKSLDGTNLEDSFDSEDEELLKELEAYREEETSEPIIVNQNLPTSETDEAWRTLEERLGSLDICQEELKSDNSVRQSSPIKKRLKQAEMVSNSKVAST